MDHLRRAAIGQRVWTKDQIKAGFLSFYALHGRYPTSHEIDAYPHLPSARSLQRSFGGLVAVRKELFPQEISNYTLGTHRSAVAKKTFHQGRDYEIAFYKYLTGVFQDIAVHEHKVIRPGNVSCDFYVYLNENEGIVIDIFYADSIINLINVVNIKLRRYALISPPTYLVVVGNEAITQSEIDKKMSNRKTPLPEHISVVSEHHFKAIVAEDLLRRSHFGR